MTDERARMRGGLLARLEAHRPADAPEDRALRAMLSFVAAEDDPFSRDNPRGHITGSAVVADGAGDRFLLVRHVRLGRWLQPGGHVDESDLSVLETALREAREETGVTDLEPGMAGAVLHVDVHEIPARGEEPAHLHYDVRYLVVAATPAARSHGTARDAAEVSGVGWFDDAGLASLSLDDSLRRAIARARAVLGGTGAERPAAR